MVCRGCSGIHAVSDIYHYKGPLINYKQELIKSLNPQERASALSLGGEHFLIVKESPLKPGESYIVDFIIPQDDKGNTTVIRTTYRGDKTMFDNSKLALSGGSYNLLITQDKV